MKIGIITFHASLNCGSMLQAFALQHVLQNRYGADVEIINFSNKGQRNYYSLWDTYPRPDVLKQNIKTVPFYSLAKKMRKDYEDFSDKYFTLTKKMYKKRSQLEGVEERYDIVITGGDQVWNIKCRDADLAYFLSFVHNKKKVSYSPSLGARDINKYAKNPNLYRNLLLDFDFLSVRERNGQKWLEKLTGKEVKIIADPTLLLTKTEWEKCFELRDIEEKFIFFYAFSYANEKNNTILQNVSKKTGMPIYILDQKSWAINKLDKFGIKKYNKSGPIAFLELIKNARLVLVQSFHGIVFATLFHKCFWSLRNLANNDSADDRARFLLEQVGLLDRAITYDELEIIDLFSEATFDKADYNINKMKKTAFEYIDSFMV